MNDVDMTTVKDAMPPRALLPAPERKAEPPADGTLPRRGAGRWLVALVAFLTLAGGLAFGAWRHYQQHRDVVADINIALRHIAASARKNVGLCEGEGCARQRHA